MKYSEYAELCVASYEGGKPFKTVGDLCYGVIKIGRKAKVVFRGSKNLENWLRNVTFMPVKSRDGYWVHRGFDSAFVVLYDYVMLDLSNALELEFTGHSLGGAIAVRFAAALHSRAITFGAPRNYIKFCAMPIFEHARIICDDDPVPEVPKLLGKHDCEPRIILKDRDGHKIEPEDHDVNVYRNRLIERGL